ncbi:MAG: DinB family protein [Bacteroidetes bacterium]|nr:DinB family protein [Bacteroidota bacterium]
MKHNFDISLQNHKIFETFLSSFEPERLFKIPEGFGNNLIWNMAHVVSVQQLLVYKRSYLPTVLPDGFVSRFAPGTQPPVEVDTTLIESLKSYLYKGVQQVQPDFEVGKFERYETFTARSGFEIDTLEKAVLFNNYHEGIHLGYVLCLKKFV